jgi:hypothetical protein
LTHFLHAEEIAVVAVTLGTNGDSEEKLVVNLVRSIAAKIMVDTRTAGHDTAKASGSRLFCGYKGYPLKTLFSDTVVSKELFNLV